MLVHLLGGVVQSVLQGPKLTVVRRAARDRAEFDHCDVCLRVDAVDGLAFLTEAFNAKVPIWIRTESCISMASLYAQKYSKGAPRSLQSAR